MRGGATKSRVHADVDRRTDDCVSDFVIAGAADLGHGVERHILDVAIDDGSCLSTSGHGNATISDEQEGNCWLRVFQRYTDCDPLGSNNITTSNNAQDDGLPEYPLRAAPSSRRAECGDGLRAMLLGTDFPVLRRQAWP